MGLGADGGEEDRNAVDDTEEIGVHDLSVLCKGKVFKVWNEWAHLVEVFRILPPALESDARIQHQEIHAPKALIDFRFQLFPIIDLANVHSVGLCFRAIFEVLFGLGEVLGVIVDEGKLHAMTAAKLCDG